MSCTFWNMRRRLRKQLGIERVVEEEKAVSETVPAQAEEKAEQEEQAEPEEQTAKKGRGKRNDSGTN